MKILVINLGSTSTKVAIYEDLEEVYKVSLEHSREELKQFACINDQLPYRKQMITDALKNAGYELTDMAAFSARGGGLCEHVGGTFKVSDLMVRDAKSEKYAKHPAQLGSQIVFQFEKETGIPAFIVNSPSTDEMKQVARITGLKGVYRHSYSHTLNQKEIGIRYGEKVGTPYEELNLVICHLGGGISITAHEHGRMIDTTDNIDGDGPMAPTRVGALPVLDVINLCFGGTTKDEAIKLVMATGGLFDHLQSFDAREIGERIKNGDHYAKNIYDAMIYQIAKYAASMHAALCCKTDAIVLTGGMANDKYLVEGIKKYIGKIAPIEVIAGEHEMEALARGAFDAVRTGEYLDYTGTPVWTEDMLYQE